ncbi:unnamed protein product [Paramecium pentaurelia]|uniref:Uncharacterized protein n=1 Tax=Paramecium pentaurelia TaxID=43138 RepID=A0A8S1SSW3_9CILI|nr:unnamed protein product [Paramecium pentaurelia]
MFIKEAYERRQKQGEGEQEILSTEQKIHKIGSIKNNKVNYDKDEQFFSKEDIPQKALQIKQFIQTFVDPDILGLRKKQWNYSVSVPKNPLSEETHERKLVKIKLGLLDHPIPKEKPNKIYVGTETRDNYQLAKKGSDKWNISVETNSVDFQKNLMNQTKKAKNHSKAKEKEIIKNYLKPIEHQIQLQQNLRSQKVNEKDFRAQIRQEYLIKNPAASQQATDGAVFRLAYEAHLSKNQQQIQDKNYTFMPDMSKTLKHNLEYKYYHNGVWQKLKDGSEGWSCCMNSTYDSPGCIKIKLDKNRWDYSSFTH